MDASIILHLQGAPEQALRCLQSLTELPEQPSHEVIIVDDASVGLAPLLDRLAGDVEIVTAPRRVGFGASARLGIARARGRVVVLLRDAPEVQANWLAPLVAGLHDLSVGAITSVTADEQDSHPVSARAIAARRDELVALGGLPVAPDGLEIAALCAELAMAGKRVQAAPESVVTPPGTRRTGLRRAPGEPIELSVVIPTLDATSDRVRRCVAAIQRATDAAHEIVVLDNGAPPQGFTAPVNAGLRATCGSYVVVMNDDVEVQPGWWPPLRAALDEGASVVFPLTEGSAMRRDFAAWCFAMSREGLERYGHGPGELFDPELRVWYQDTDLLERLRAVGKPPQCVDASRIRHGLSETVASDDPALRAWIEQEIARDKAAFHRKHASAA